MEKGYDLTKDLIPVTTSQHYFMGGITVDMDGRTSLDNLYACGEIAFTGLHGRNRLASNSLLEGLVFGNRVANDINKELSTKIDNGELIIKNKNQNQNFKNIDIKKIEEENRRLVIDEILKVREDLKDELSVN